MNIKLLLCSLCFFTLMLHAQKNLIHGSVINQNNDTVYGDIEFKNNILIHTTCRIRLKGDTLFTVYTPNDIKGFQFNGGKVYESKQMRGGTPLFLERIGKKSQVVYYKHDLKGYHYYIENTKSELKEIPYYVHRYPLTGKMVLIHSNLNYGLSNTIDIEDKDTEDIPFRKSFNLEITGGKVFDQTISLSDNVFHLSALVNICNPYVKSNFYFRTGIQSLDFTRKHESALYRIPIQVEFQTTGDYINARIAAGMNVYHPFELTGSLMLGMEMRLSKTFSWTITYDVDYHEIKFPFNTPYLNSLSTGFMIGL